MVVIPIAVVICLSEHSFPACRYINLNFHEFVIVAVIMAVVITVMIMRRKIKDAGKAMIYEGHGVRGLYPERTGSDSPPLHRYMKP